MESVNKNLFSVVAIGASAGNQAALRDFFSEIPSTTNACFIIVLHLVREYKSRMAEIISEFTPLHVVRVTDECSLQPRTVYVMPEGVTMEIKSRVLHLRQRQTNVVKNTAIDNFFVTLAREEMDKSIGVVLSGMGSDGTKGAIEIHRDGGKLFVQDPETTEYSGMPQSVIQCDHPDLIAPPRELGRAVSKIVAERYGEEFVK